MKQPFSCWFTPFDICFSGLQQRARHTHHLTLPPSSSPNYRLSYLQLHYPTQDSTTMRPFAILATICAATIGTTSGMNPVLLIHVYNLCAIQRILILTLTLTLLSRLCLLPQQSSALTVPSCQLQLSRAAACAMHYGRQVGREPLWLLFQSIAKKMCLYRSEQVRTLAEHSTSNMSRITMWPR